MSSVPVGRFPHSAVYADGYLWVTSYDDYTLSKVNPETLEVETVTRSPGGRAGSSTPMGHCWLFLYHRDSWSESTLEPSSRTSRSALTR